MTNTYLPLRTSLAAVAMAWTLIGLAGCHAIDFYDPTMEAPMPLQMVPPREKEKVSLPAYRIEPPDVLQIEMLKLVPLPPYRIEVYDVLQIAVVGTLLDQPVGPTDSNGGYYLVEGEGTINLGPAYGTVRVAGMTRDEAKVAIDQQLRKVLVNPVVSVQLARASGTQPVTGEYLVGPDGTVNLRQYGSVHLSGKTISQSKVDLEKHLAQFFDSPQVAVNILAYNSKVYYIITEGANLGDNIVRVPVTGNETVLDALSNVGGISQLSSKNIWIARPGAGDSACEQILPIDYDSITRGGMTATNYQILPGDRVFISEDGLVALSNWVNKMLAPMERIAGVTSLYGSTVRSFQMLGRNFQRSRTGF